MQRVRICSKNPLHGATITFIYFQANDARVERSRTLLGTAARHKKQCCSLRRQPWAAAAEMLGVFSHGAGKRLNVNADKLNLLSNTQSRNRDGQKQGQNSSNQKYQKAGKIKITNRCKIQNQVITDTNQTAWQRVDNTATSKGE